MLAVAYSKLASRLARSAFRCSWIYLKVGKKLAETGSASPLYQRWIDLYAGDEVREAMIQDVLAIANRLGASADDRERERIARHFVTGARFEWMFWDMGCRRGEQWPV